MSLSSTSYVSDGHSEIKRSADDFLFSGEKPVESVELFSLDSALFIRLSLIFYNLQACKKQ